MCGKYETMYAKLCMWGCVCKAVCMRPSVCELYAGWRNLRVTQTVCEAVCKTGTVSMVLCVLVCERDLVLPGHACTLGR